MEYAWEELDVDEEIIAHKWHTPINNCTVTQIKSSYLFTVNAYQLKRPEIHFLQK